MTRNPRMTRPKAGRREGFTLVELMIVLAILILLVAMVGPRLLGSQKKADVKATVQQISNLEEALKLYAVDNRAYPTTEEGLQTLLRRPSDERRARNWDGPYLDDDQLPVDPWGSEFGYEYPPAEGTRDVPSIWSPGPDAEENTEDDIKNFKSADEVETDGNEIGGSTEL